MRALLAQRFPHAEIEAFDLSQSPYRAPNSAPIRFVTAPPVAA